MLPYWLVDTGSGPKTPVTDVGWLAYANDPEGNLFGMIERDPSVSPGP